MAPHIVSWGWNEVKNSPVISSPATPSVVPIESLLSDPYAKSPIIPEASRARTTEPAARPASFLGVGTGESETPDGSCRQRDDSSLQHSKYFFKDGNVTFLVRQCYMAYAPNVLRSPRSMTFFTVFTVISSLAILCISPLDLPSSEFVTTRLHRRLCR